jgi:hypothetical protein
MKLFLLSLVSWSLFAFSTAQSFPSIPCYYSYAGSYYSSFFGVIWGSIGAASWGGFNGTFGSATQALCQANCQSQYLYPCVAWSYNPNNNVCQFYASTVGFGIPNTCMGCSSCSVCNVNYRKDIDLFKNKNFYLY